MYTNENHTIIQRPKIRDRSHVPPSVTPSILPGKKRRDKLAKVRIVNAKTDGPQFTSLGKATKYVRDGHAVWVKDAIRFTRSKGDPELTMETVEQMKRLPVMRPMDMMIKRTQQRHGKSKAYRTGTVRIVQVKRGGMQTENSKPLINKEIDQSGEVIR